MTNFKEGDKVQVINNIIHQKHEIGSIITLVKYCDNLTWWTGEWLISNMEIKAIFIPHPGVNCVF